MTTSRLLMIAGLGFVVMIVASVVRPWWAEALVRIAGASIFFVALFEIAEQRGWLGKGRRRRR